MRSASPVASLCSCVRSLRWRPRPTASEPASSLGWRPASCRAHLLARGRLCRALRLAGRLRGCLQERGRLARRTPMRESWRLRRRFPRRFVQSRALALRSPSTAQRNATHIQAQEGRCSSSAFQLQRPEAAVWAAAAAASPSLLRAAHQLRRPVGERSTTATQCSASWACSAVKLATTTTTTTTNSLLLFRCCCCLTTGVRNPVVRSAGAASACGLWLALLSQTHTHTQHSQLLLLLLYLYKQNEMNRNEMKLFSHQTQNERE